VDVVGKTVLLLVREVATVRRLRANDLVEERIYAAVDRARRRRDAGIEVEVETDRAAVLGPEGRQIAQSLPRHGRSHRLPSPCRKAAILLTHLGTFDPSAIGSTGHFRRTHGQSPRVLRTASQATPWQRRSLRSVTARALRRSSWPASMRPACEHSSTFAAIPARAAIRSSGRRRSGRLWARPASPTATRRRSAAAAAASPARSASAAFESPPSAAMPPGWEATSGRRR